LLARVRDDRSLVSKLIDEAIRFEPTSTVKVRQAARDVEIGGVKIPQGALGAVRDRLGQPGRGCF
jgi:cytochrome P450